MLQIRAQYTVTINHGLPYLLSKELHRTVVLRSANPTSTHMKMGKTLPSAWWVNHGGEVDEQYCLANEGIATHLLSSLMVAIGPRSSIVIASIN